MISRRRRRLHVTGFLGFGRFAVNPAALLAESCGRDHTLLEVSFRAVDAFVEQFAHDGAFDDLLMLGVAGERDVIKIERCAANHVACHADVCGEVRGPAEIEPGGPPTLPSTLFAPAGLCDLALSDDAGCYLCNYAYYRALHRLPSRKRVGFVHVPPIEAMPLAAQQAALARLIEALEAARNVD